MNTLNKPIYIESIKIGDDCKPFIIAEMSGNHNQSLERALEIVQAAKNAGAHAIKLQTYTPDTMTLKGIKVISDKGSLWKGRELYDLYQEAYTPWEWHGPIFKKARQLGIIPFSTPFDESSVNFLKSLDVQVYKIASFENTDLPLLKKVAATGKPIIISTGASNISEIDESVRLIRECGNNNIILLKCTSSYPATPEDSNVKTIPHLKKLFNCHVGLSDHTLGIGVALASIALGATVIEKHFTINRSEGGVDAAFSMEPHEFKILVEESERAFLGLGEIKYGVLDAEKSSLTFKRSIYIVKDMKSGEIFTENNIRVIRPAMGLAPKYFEMVLGKKINRDVKKGAPLTFELIG